jgi:hypothetical protein
MYFAVLHYDGIEIWDYQSKVHLSSLKASASPLLKNFGHSFCFSNDGRMLATVTADAVGVVVWDIAGMNDCKVKYALTRPKTSVCMHTVAVSQKMTRHSSFHLEIK